MQIIAEFAGIILFLTAMLSRAAAPDPFPNQPGALSPVELQAATEAMKSMLGKP